jgi:outer membrane biogenesis lipoprotein LolB
MTHKLLRVVFVVALVVIAGCSGTSGVDTNNQTEPTATEITTTTTSGSTTLNQTLLDSHSITLIDAGSYTAEVTTSENSTSTTTAAEINLTAQSKYEQLTTITDSSSFTLETYRGSGSDTVYTKVGSGESASYTSDDAAGNFTADSIAEPYLITDVQYQQFGTETINGTTVQRYVANDVDSLSVESDGWGGPIVTNISSTVLVDADRGLIYQIDAQYTVQTSSGAERTVSYAVSYSDVGSTDVTEPTWLSNARND